MIWTSRRISWSSFFFALKMLRPSSQASPEVGGISRMVERAARTEGAARRHGQRVRDAAGNHVKAFLLLPQPRDGGEQSLGVGVLGAGKEFLGRRLLHEAARVTHGHAVAHLGGH